jgi:hypothetical protein
LSKGSIKTQLVSSSARRNIADNFIAGTITYQPPVRRSNPRAQPSIDHSLLAKRFGYGQSKRARLDIENARRKYVGTSVEDTALIEDVVDEHIYLPGTVELGGGWQTASAHFDD